MFIFKFLFYFSVSFLILSFPMGKTTVFDHLHGYASPYTNSFFQGIQDKSSEIFHGTLSISRKIFTNITPSTRDSVNENLSAIKRDDDGAAKEQDSYTAEERDMLSSILKKAQ